MVSHELFTCAFVEEVEGEANKPIWGANDSPHHSHLWGHRQKQKDTDKDKKSQPPLRTKRQRQKSKPTFDVNSEDWTEKLTNSIRRWNLITDILIIDMCILSSWGVALFRAISGISQLSCCGYLYCNVLKFELHHFRRRRKANFEEKYGDKNDERPPSSVLWCKGRWRSGPEQGRPRQWRENWWSEAKSILKIQ